MIAGLVNTGPTLNVPVPDSKERNSEKPGASKFNDVLDSKLDPKVDRPDRREEVVKTEKPERAQLSPEKIEKGRVKRQEDSENKTEDPLDPQVMDPRTSALRAQRDRAIRKFMDSFESEFGIPPEEMVVAMSQLTTQDLEKPPEKTVDSIIAELELAPQDESKAKNMYLGLLTQLKEIDTRVAMPQPQNDLLSQMSAQRFQLSADKKEVMAGQVQGLSEKFWMRDAQNAKALTPEMNQLQVREFLKKMITAESVAGVEAEPEVMASTENFMKQLKLEMPDIDAGDETLEFAPKKEMSFTPDSMAAKALADGQAKSQEQSMNGQQQQGQNNAPMPEIKNGISMEAIQAELQRLGIKPMDAEGIAKKLEKATANSMAGLEMGSLSQAKLDPMLSILPAGEVQPKVEMSPVQKTENVQQIMNQAQILLKNGGGEVKVEMSPEGMGSIQLKLQVLDGKVQVHMNTETKEAKNLIESSMQDLKKSLAAHQLSVDLVKVDVVTQANTSNNTNNANSDLQNQMQNHFNQQQRDGTKQFWQQFNDSFGNRQAREGFFDAQNIRSGPKAQTLPGFDRTSSNGRARSDGRGKSLNLVA